VPYLSKFATKFNEVIRDLNARLSFYSLNKLGGIVKAHKDILLKLSNKNVVYKLCCKNCDASYVGQTLRQIKTRISEPQLHQQEYQHTIRNYRTQIAT